MGWKIIYNHENDRCSSSCLNMKRSLRLLVEKLKEQNTMHPHARLTSCMERGEGRYVIVQAHKCLCCCCCSAAKSCLTLWPMNFSTSGLPVPHHLPEFAQVHVHWNGDATQPSHPLLPSSPFAFNLSQHQGLFQWVGSSHQVVRVLELQLQHQSFQWANAWMNVKKKK